jgi:hypothetical protein
MRRNATKLPTATLPVTLLSIPKVFYNGVNGEEISFFPLRGTELIIHGLPSRYPVTMTTALSYLQLFFLFIIIAHVATCGNTVDFSCGSQQTVVTAGVPSMP